MIKVISVTLSSFIILGLSLTGCGVGGGGGGGKDPLQAALVTIDADPAAIKIGDRTLVTVEMQNIDSNGVFLKLRYSKDLAYIVDTAFLEVADESVDVGPVEGPVENPNYTYLTFYFPSESFGDEDYGKLTFQLRATAVNDQAEAQVDVDLLDPGADPRDAFDEKAPLFGAEDSTEVEINSD